jgi:hypothetical protein
MEYTGSFLTQFFLYPAAGALILTAAGAVIYIISDFIFSRYGNKVVIWLYAPVLFVAAMHSNYLYTIAYTLGFITSLGYFAVYISARKEKLQYYYIIIGFPILYYISGGYALSALLLCFVNELFFSRNRSRMMKALIIILFAALVPYLASILVFYIKPASSWTYFLPFFINAPVKYVLLLLLVYYPLALIISKKMLLTSGNRLHSPAWNLRTIVVGTFFMVCLSGLIIKFVYDRRAEIILGMDHCIQNSDWEGTLELSTLYPDTNRLVMYFTNLALYKTGRMGDQMFHYPQAGTGGLWLDWKRDGATAFFGGEIYQNLAYTNEANRWAFEAMVAKGTNPRSLKRLAFTNMVNGEQALASKYLHLLSQSLFYRKWARHYSGLLSKSTLPEDDSEILHFRDFLVQSDFFANTNKLNLQALLINHPDNKMAYDYLVAASLLENNMEGFARLIQNLRYYGYTRLPVHIEEALIFYNVYNKSNFVPEGFTLSPETIRRFQDFAAVFVRSGNNPALMEKELKGRYGKTYWYYIHKSKTI